MNALKGIKKLVGKNKLYKSQMHNKKSCTIDIETLLTLTQNALHAHR